MRTAERRAIGAAAGLVAAAALLAPAAAQEQPGRLEVRPTLQVNLADPGTRLGAFTITNVSSRRFAVKALPVLLDQGRNGDVVALTDRVSRERAAARIRARGSFTLAPGARRAVRPRVRAGTPGRGFYGGVLFEAREPGSAAPSLQLVASLILRPLPAAQRRRAVSAGVRAEPRTGGITVIGAVRNAGNVDVKPRGRIDLVRDGRVVVSSAPVQARRILPGATVDLPARLPAAAPGRYQARAELVVGDDALALAGVVTVLPSGEPRFADAGLVSIDAEPSPNGRLQVHGRFRSKGNTDIRPRAVAELRRLGPAGQQGGIVAREALVVERAGPGRLGDVNGEIRVPGQFRHELTVRLLDGDRPLDARALALAPVAEASLLDEVSDWVGDNPELTLVILAAVLVLLGTLQILWSRRRSRKGSPVRHPARVAPLPPPSEEVPVAEPVPAAAEAEQPPPAEPEPEPLPTAEPEPEPLPAPEPDPPTAEPKPLYEPEPLPEPVPLAPPAPEPLPEPVAVAPPAPEPVPAAPPAPEPAAIPHAVAKPAAAARPITRDPRVMAAGAAVLALGLRALRRRGR